MTPILRRTASSDEQIAEPRLNQMYVSNWKTSQGTVQRSSTISKRISRS